MTSFRLLLNCNSPRVYLDPDRERSVFVYKIEKKKSRTYLFRSCFNCCLGQTSAAKRSHPPIIIIIMIERFLLIINNGGKKKNSLWDFHDRRNHRHPIGNRRLDSCRLSWWSNRCAQPRWSSPRSVAVVKVLRPPRTHVTVRFGCIIFHVSSVIFRIAGYTKNRSSRQINGRCVLKNSNTTK